MDAGVTLVAAAVGAVISLAAVYIQHFLSEDAQTKQRNFDTASRARENGIAEAKNALGQLDRIRDVFDRNEKDYEPGHELYAPYYHQAQLHIIGIDDVSVANTLSRIADVYYDASSATELDEWFPRQLSNILSTLAQETVRAYIHRDPAPDSTVLDEMEAEIAASNERYRENFEAARAALRAQRAGQEPPA